MSTGLQPEAGNKLNVSWGLPGSPRQSGRQAPILGEAGHGHGHGRVTPTFANR